MDADFNLHKVLVGMSGHGRLVQEHEKLIHQVRFQMTHIGLTARDFRLLLDDHMALKDAVSKGDVSLAGQLAETHNSAEVERLLAEAASEKSTNAGRKGPA
jgi:DNA-binding GntR family transcriptional regulator